MTVYNIRLQNTASLLSDVFFLHLSTQKLQTVPLKKKKTTTQQCTRPRTQTQTWVCAPVYSFHRSNRGGGSGNGPSAGERLPQATSPADAQCSGPRVFRHHAPPQRHRGLRLRHPHLQEQTAVRRWDRGLLTLSRMNYQTTRLFFYLFFYTIYVFLKELLKWINARGDSGITFKSFYSQRTKQHFQRKRMLE